MNVTGNWHEEWERNGNGGWGWGWEWEWQQQDVVEDSFGVENLESTGDGMPAP